jgi:large subunit ribosomal protein L2
MALKQHRPLTPTQRYYVANTSDEISTVNKPQRGLVKAKRRTGGRNAYGRVTSRRRGGGHKKQYRVLDFHRDKLDIPATVQALEYDPNRSAHLALLAYADGEKRYILAPLGVHQGSVVISSAQAEFSDGNSMPLRVMPPATRVHAIELVPGRGAKIGRSAGAGAQLIKVDGDQATLKLPSGEIRIVHSNCRATIGEVGNTDHSKVSLGKAGRNRWLGRRPRVRGVAMNPVDHPMGGGEGRTSGGGQPVSPWGQLAKGFPTRRRSKPSNSMILVRRNGKKMRAK